MKQEITITTESVDINVVRVGRKQMTKIVFSQIPEIPIFEYDKIKILGIVNHKCTSILYEFFESKFWALIVHQNELYKAQLEPRTKKELFRNHEIRMKSIILTGSEKSAGSIHSIQNQAYELIEKNKQLFISI